MSKEKQDQGINFNDYDGDYQAGEVIGQDGETIDLDELERDSKTGIPLFVKLGFLLLCIGLGGFAFVVFSQQAPITIKKRVPPPEKDAILDKALTALNINRTKEFEPFFSCWQTLASHESKPSLNAKSLQEACPATKGENSSYQPSCSGDKCKKVILQKCVGSNCTNVEGIRYQHFVYMMMQRYANSYNRLLGDQRLYGAAKEAHKDQKRSEDSKKPSAKLEQLAGVAKKLQAKMNATLMGEGFPASDWYSPHYSLKKDALFAQAVARIQSISGGVKKAASKAPKAAPKKKKRRRRSRRKKAAPRAKSSGGINAGVIVGLKSFPQKALLRDDYKTISRYYRVENRADQIGQSSSIRYDGVSTNFWTHATIQTQLHRCAAKHVKDKVETIKVKIGVDAEDGSVIQGTALLTATGEQSAGLRKCLLKALTRLTYRAIDVKKKRLNVRFTIELRP